MENMKQPICVHLRSSAVCYSYTQKQHRISIGAEIIKNSYDKYQGIKSDEDCKCS